MYYTDGTKYNNFTAVVRLDGLDCDELRPSRAGRDGQCWIAVKSGQALSVFCDIKLAVSQYQVDLVVDGVLRNLFLSTVSPKASKRAKIVEFYEGNHKHARSLYRSPLVTSRLQEKADDSIIYNSSDNTRVGTIEILVYRYDMGYNHARTAELPENVVDWEDLEGQPGCAGIKPTHETVLAMENGKRLNDNERRTWKNKTDKPPMGRSPWVTFKFLYRHETTLKEAALVNHQLNVISRNSISSLRTTTLRKDTESSMSYTRHNGNPWVVREHNGLREYKQLHLTPDNPGPQLGRNRGKHSRKSATHISEGLVDSDHGSNDVSDYDPEYVSSGFQNNIYPTSEILRSEVVNSENPSKRSKSTDAQDSIKHGKAKVVGLRAEIIGLQLKRDQARRQLKKKKKTEPITLDEEQELALLTAHKESLEREIDFINLEAAKYADLEDEPEEHNYNVGVACNEEDAMSIDATTTDTNDQRSQILAMFEGSKSSSEEAMSQWTIIEKPGQDAMHIVKEGIAASAKHGIAPGLVAAMLAHPIADIVAGRDL